MSYAALKFEINTDPASKGYAGKSPAEQAALLNAPIATVRPIPLTELNALIDTRLLPLKLIPAQQSTDPNIQGAAVMALRLFSARYDTLDVTDPAKMAIVNQLLGVLVQGAVFVQADADAILSLAVGIPTSRALIVFGYPVSEFDVIGALA